MTRIAGSDCEFMLISIHSRLNKDCTTSRESVSSMSRLMRGFRYTVSSIILP